MKHWIISHMKTHLRTPFMPGAWSIMILLGLILSGYSGSKTGITPEDSFPGTAFFVNSGNKARDIHMFSQQDIEAGIPILLIKQKDQIIELDLAQQEKYDVKIDFGRPAPDSVTIIDSFLSESGKEIYNASARVSVPVELNAEGTASFSIKQHMAYYLSSNLKSYYQPAVRLFKIICCTEEQTTEYYLLIKVHPDSPWQS